MLGPSSQSPRPSNIQININKVQIGSSPGDSSAREEYSIKQGSRMKRGVKGVGNVQSSPLESKVKKIVNEKEDKRSLRKHVAMS